MAHGLTRELLDTHVHLWDLAVSPQDWIDGTMAVLDRDFLAGDLAAALDAVAVPRAVAVQATSSIAETAFLLDEAADPHIRGVVGWLDVTGDVPAQCAAFARHPNSAKLVGIRHPAHLEDNQDWLLLDEVVRGIRAIAAQGLAFDLVVRPWQLRSAAALAGSVPEARFVLDHLGKPPIASGELDAWGDDLATLASHENVVAKVSGLTIEADWRAWTAGDLRPVVDRALELFGADRLLFGSDWPLVQLTEGGYAGWLAAYLDCTSALSSSERAAIDSSNALRVYRLRA